MAQMIMNNMIKICLLSIILSIKIVLSLIPIDRFAHSSVLVDKKIYFFGGESNNGQKFSPTLDQILYLDISKPFNTATPPVEIISNVIPFGSSFATALLDRQRNIIYLFGGIMKDVNTNNDNFKSILHSYNLETNNWDIPKTNGIEPVRRREIKGVINNETGKFYIFGGGADQFVGAPNANFNDMNIFDTISLTWSKGSTTNAPSTRTDYTAMLLSNGIIVFIGGRTDVNINQLPLYDTKSDIWSLMATRGATLENRSAHSAVLTPDERIIIFGGEKSEGPVTQQLAVLDTKTFPYEWSIPQVTATISPPPLTRHSATLVGDYMLVNFGNNSYPIINPNVNLPFFYILDIRNFTWVTQFEPKISPSTTNTPTNPLNNLPTNPPNNSPNNINNSNLSSDKFKTVGIIVGVVVSACIGGIIFVFLGYKFYKKRKYNNAIPTAGTNYT